MPAIAGHDLPLVSVTPRQDGQVARVQTIRTLLQLTRHRRHQNQSKGRVCFHPAGTGIPS